MDCGEETRPPSAEPEKILGDYRLVRLIGQGAMGQVYEAVQMSLDRRVALKLLIPELAGSEEFLARFRREAKSAAAISHHNVVPIFDIGEDSGVHFFAMEFVDGESLRDRLNRVGSLEEMDALKIVREIARGLEAAAVRDIVHRDIKPDNVLCGDDGSIKIADLGLARSMSLASELTMTGAGLGTPNYISPEQASGSSTIDHRSDIYSLGITLFHLVTGKVPFSGSSPMAVAMAHVEEPLPSGVDMETGMSSGIDRLVQRMAAKQPNERFPDYSSLIAELDRLIGDVPVKPDHAESAKRQTRPVIYISLCVCLLVLLSIGVLRWKQTDDSLAEPPATPSTANQKGGERWPDDVPSFARGTLVPPIDAPGVFPLPVPSAPALILPTPEEGRRPDELFSSVAAFADAYPTNYVGILSQWLKLWRTDPDEELRRRIEAKADETAKRLGAAQETETGRLRERMFEHLRRDDYDNGYQVWLAYPPELRTPAGDQRIYQLITNYIPVYFRSAETGIRRPAVMPKSLPGYLKNSVKPPPPAE